MYFDASSAQLHSGSCQGLCVAPGVVNGYPEGVAPGVTNGYPEGVGGIGLPAVLLSCDHPHTKGWHKV